MHEAKIRTIKKIRNSLSQIYKCLLEHQLSVDDSELDWPKKISSLIILIDDAMEFSLNSDQDIFDPIVNKIKSLFFSPMDNDIGFYERVSALKEIHPSLLLNLGELMQLMVELVKEPSSQIQI